LFNFKKNSYFKSILKMLANISSRYLTKTMLKYSHRNLNTSVSLLNNNNTTDQSTEPQQQQPQSQNIENELKSLLEKHKKCETDLADFKVN
jgi:hypothetical protein